MGVVKIKRGRALRVAAFAGIVLLVLYVIFSSNRDSTRPINAVKKVRLISFLITHINKSSNIIFAHKFSRVSNASCLA
jgi:uncharacterized membrane protein YozB (DUF420 family)